MKHLKVGDIVTREHDVIETTGTKTFLFGTLFKVFDLKLINTIDIVNELVCLRPLFSECGTEVGPINIRDITTCDELIKVNTKQAQRILKKKNYKRDSKICSGIMIVFLIFFGLGILSSILSAFSPTLKQFMSGPANGPVAVLLGVILCVSFFGLLALNEGCAIVRDDAIKCVLATRALRVNNPNVCFTQINLNGSGVNMSPEEIEQQAIEALLRAKNIQKNIAKGKGEIYLSPFHLGEKRNEYPAYKAVAKNTLDNLELLQVFLQS